MLCHQSHLVIFFQQFSSVAGNNFPLYLQVGFPLIILAKKSEIGKGKLQVLREF